MSVLPGGIAFFPSFDPAYTCLTLLMGICWLRAIRANAAPWSVAFGASLALAAFTAFHLLAFGSFLAIGVKGLRPVLGGLSVGFAGFLAYAWWSKAPALAYLPFSFLAGPWLLINTFVCLFIARALLQKETAR